MAHTNADIPILADRGSTAKNGTGSFWTEPSPTYFDILAGWLTRNMKMALKELARENRIEQVIYSYSTVLAFKIDGVWVRIFDRHSPTTSTRHESQLWKLPNVVYCPPDANREEIERIVAGQTRYIPNYRNVFAGSYKAA